MIDIIQNGKASGSVATMLLNNNFETGMLRPWVGEDGNSYVTVNKRVDGKSVATSQRIADNAATLRKDEWIVLDKVCMQVARNRLKLVADLRKAGLVFNVPGGMGATVLQTETQSDTGPASISMDGLRRSQNDRPEYNINNMPLPIVHAEFSFSARQLAASRRGDTPLDTTLAEQRARKVAESLEALHLGTASSYAFGGGSIYGLINFPGRMTKTLTNPAVTAWTPATTVNEVLAMRKQSMDAFHYGPWMLYVGVGWDQYLDRDYSAAKGDNTLRDRIAAIRGITAVETLDYLTGYQMVLVQWTQDVIRTVLGMDMTTVQWESQGGLELNFKILTIQVPQVRADFNGATGIVHGS